MPKFLSNIWQDGDKNPVTPLLSDIVRGCPDVLVKIKYKKQIKRLSLRISPIDGSLSLSLPPSFDQKKAISFIKSHEQWIRKTFAQLILPQKINIGASIPIEGVKAELCHASSRFVHLDGNRLAIPKSNAPLGPQVAGFLKTLARDRLVLACDYYAAKLGQSYSKITLRDTRTRWGSCTHDKRLMFSWRLVMAPPHILHYVAAHEVAHLIHMNHSPAFWQVVADLFPQWKSSRHWLQKEGVSLHFYQFST